MDRISVSLLGAWTSKLKIWISGKFDTVNGKIGTSAQGSTNTTLFKAIENIQFPEGIAMEAQATLNKEAILQAVNNIDLSAVAKQGVDTTATMTALKTLIQALPEDADLTALKTALQGNDTTATLSAIKTLISAIPTTQPTDYAKQGNNANVSLSTIDTKLDAATGGITMMTEAEKPYALADLDSHLTDDEDESN